MQWGEGNLTSVVAWNCGRRRANYLSSVVYVSDVCETFRSVREVNTCGDTRTSRDSGKIICNSQATVYAKTHPCTASRRHSYSWVTELPYPSSSFTFNPIGHASLLQFLRDEMQSCTILWSTWGINYMWTMLRNKITLPLAHYSLRIFYPFLCVIIFVKSVLWNRYLFS